MTDYSTLHEYICARQAADRDAIDADAAFIAEHDMSPPPLPLPPLVPNLRGSIYRTFIYKVSIETRAESWSSWHPTDQTVKP